MSSSLLSIAKKKMKKQKELFHQNDENEETVKSYVWLQTVDSCILQVELEIAELSPVICHQVKSGVGYTKSKPICVPPRVKQAALASVFDYCRFHQAPGRSDKERKLFDDNFFKKNTDTLCLLLHASHYLELKVLSEELCEIVASNVVNSSPIEQDEFFNNYSEDTERLKLEPWLNSIGGSRGRLLRKLSTKKKKENEVPENAKKVEAEMEAQKTKDTYSVDDLVSFINGGCGDMKKAQTKKKKNRKKKEGQKVDSTVWALAEGSSSTWDGSLPSEDEFDDDDFDPEWKEETDRLVEEFARRLNVPYIRPEINPLSQERGLVPHSTEENSDSCKMKD